MFAGDIDDTVIEDGAGESEVSEDGISAVGEEHVGGFEVTMDDAVFMGVEQGGGDLRREAESICGGEGALLVEVLGEAAPFEVGHDEVGVGGGVLDFEDAEDIGVIELLEVAGFGEEAFPASGVGDEFRE
ncbi:MAG: hypothetical protein RI897_3412, partial [Verrucomicrobiota bacterium]